MCLLGSRVLISLKEAGDTEVNNGSASQLGIERTLSTAEFRVTNPDGANPG